MDTCTEQVNVQSCDHPEGSAFYEGHISNKLIMIVSLLPLLYNSVPYSILHYRQIAKMDPQHKGQKFYACRKDKCRFKKWVAEAEPQKPSDQRKISDMWPRHAN